MTTFILDLEKIYGDDQITVKRGKIHLYFWMDFDQSTGGKLKVSLTGHINTVRKVFLHIIYI